MEKGRQRRFLKLHTCFFRISRLWLLINTRWLILTWDSKFDENLSGRFIEGWSTVGQQWAEGWNRGQAGDEIIKYSLGITGDSTEEIAKNLVEYMNKGNTGEGQ